ncbi:helix-turn-helix transcriptional regulator [Catenulispora subtropica]|uniref:Helix-turn-helix transcriptional regulator n=1 Tax=Catenulispora subtropica TaxID=450798 RepID=A0ABN2T5D1_9ACTN
MTSAEPSGPRAQIRSQDPDDTEHGGGAAAPVSSHPPAGAPPATVPSPAARAPAAAPSAATAPPIRRRRLGAALRRLRLSAGLTLQGAAERLEISDSTLSRLENGQGRLRRIDVAAALDVYGVRDEELRTTLLNLTGQIRDKGWWQYYRRAIPEPYADYISVEAAATTIDAHTVQLVHGLLQTEPYIRAVAEAWRVRTEPLDVDALVAVRRTRQRMLGGPDPLRLRVVMHESALRQMVGGPEVMRGQIERVLEESRRPNVVIQIITHSAGAYSGLDEPFAIVGFGNPLEHDVVCLDNLTRTHFLETVDEVRNYASVFDQLRAAALSPERSALWLADLLTKMES